MAAVSASPSSSQIPLTREQQITVEAHRLTGVILDQFHAIVQEAADECGREAAEHGRKAAEHKQNAQQLHSELEVKKAKQAALIKKGMGKVFYEVFHGKGKTLTLGLINQIFENYLAHLTKETPMSTKENFLAINTSDHFVRYIKDRAEAGVAITTLDFSYFASKIKGDMKDLSTFLSQMDCTVSSILIKGQIPEATKANLLNVQRDRSEIGNALNIVWA